MKSWFRPTVWKRTVFFIFSDAILSLVTLYAAYLLRFNFHIPDKFMHSFWITYGVLAVLKIGVLYRLKGYFVIWRFFGFEDAKTIVKAHLVAYGAFIGVYLLFSSWFAPFPRSVIIIDFFLSLIVIGVFRAAKRLWLERVKAYSYKPTLLLGARTGAGTVVQSALKRDIDYYPVAIVALDDDEAMTHAYIHGLQVYSQDDIEKVVREHRIEAAIITETVPQSLLKKFTDRLNALGVFEIKRLRLLGDQQEKLEDLSIEDLLARRPQDLDPHTIHAFIRDKRVLITGAGGSIGSEIARLCRRFGAVQLVLIDNNEYALYRLGEELDGAELKLVDVTHRDAIGEVMQHYRPDVVIHAAAYKHVPICEANPDAAVYNNVLGTKNVIDASIESKAGKVVVISTDKAVRPTNIMGATKRVGELYAQNVPGGKTDIVAVRFGNVLGSSGSVIPKFKAQIEAGGPVTVTHPEMTRYFMLIPEACQLVLQAAAIAEGGELFILDMGEPVKIVELARQMIRLYGKEGEVEIAFTGLRPGEKLYEELLLDESEQKTRYRSIFVARPTAYDFAQLCRDIETLLKAEEKSTALRRIVPEYTPRSNEE